MTRKVCSKVTVLTFTAADRSHVLYEIDASFLEIVLIPSFATNTIAPAVTGNHSHNPHDRAISNSPSP
jgi:hypothetical protein